MLIKLVGGFDAFLVPTDRVHFFAVLMPGLNYMWWELKSNRTSMSHYTNKALKVKCGLEVLCCWHIVWEKHLHDYHAASDSNCLQQANKPVRCAVMRRSTILVLSRVSTGKLADPLSPLCNTYPRVHRISRPGDIEHLIKHTPWGSNVTVLSRAQSIPSWPFSVFTFVEYQAWWYGWMEGLLRRHAVHRGGW